MRLVKSATFCSSCHCQHEQKSYVDFDAYWDGPTIDQEGSIKVPIDDLVICEDCLKAAGNLIGMVDNKQMRRENYELGKAAEEKEEYIAKCEKVIADLEHSLGLSLSGKIKRGKGRPTLRLPENLEAELNGT
jgi:hypothetical protein